ncbi:hypothetical protein GOP47_0019650 [Adiantum capillus-veneris]|uniref:N-acetylglucosaminylphosphatidylinositol deacetylase n=1 Tax=Adiantum capillus-veneris TaxID=13818 RepID=A0A9D4UBQ4_ADICA|nr:hypothetical protein GOP47_0019650 [Adiantum capillus-veneris]
MGILLLAGAAALLTWLLAFLMLLAFSPSPHPLPSVQASSKKRKNVLLVVAHPDDESMFFAPTLLSLASLGCYHVRVLCLSNGNAEGLGAIREQEMLSACCFLKVPTENVDILDDPALQDGQGVIWSASLISEVLERTLTNHNIDTIITFDSYGVSGHPNHTAVHRGVCDFLLDCAKSYKQKDLCVEAWKLESVSIIKKYSGPIYGLWSMWTYRTTSQSHQFFNRAPRHTIQAMQRHATQWLWYRRLFVVFSHYSYMNTLHRFST